MAQTEIDIASMSKEGSSSEQKETNIINNVVKVGKCNEPCTNSNGFVRSGYPSAELLMNSIYVPMYGENVCRHDNTILDIYRDDTKNIYSLRKMCSFSHTNLLSCYYIQEINEDIWKMFNETKDFVKQKNATYYMVLIEKISGTLDAFVRIPNPKFKELTIKGCLSEHCLQLIWDIINGIRYIHSKKTYHGFMKSHGTPFVYKNKEIVVKLANFIEKKDSLEQAQRQDWLDLGHFLNSLLNACVNVNVFTDHLDQAIDYFANINMDNIADMDDELRQLDFFKTPEDRWMFARKLPSWCHTHKKVLKTRYAKFVRMPWVNFRYKYGYLVVESMNGFKKKDGENKSENDYDTNDIVSFLKWISGVYAHYNSFEDIKQISKGLKHVDAFIRSEFPDLFPRLRQLEMNEGF